MSNTTETTTQDGEMVSVEMQKYEMDKKFELRQALQQDKLKQASEIRIGDSNAAQISLLADKYSKGGDMVPKEFQNSPEKCFVALSKGASLGLDPLTSLQNIAVINGRATIWGDTALALVRKCGELEKFKETVEEVNGKLVAKCSVKRKGFDEVTEEFTQEDAEKAKLWGRNVWNTHPKRMLKYKARAFALRDQFSDVIHGLHLKEEMEGEMIDVTNTRAPINNDAKQNVSVKDALGVEDQTVDLFNKPTLVANQS